MENILRKFAIIEENCDTRQQSKVRHPLREVLAMLVVGHINGCNTPNECLTYAEYHQDIMKRFSPFEYGLPSNDTMYRILDLIDKKYMNLLLEEWIKDIDGDIISIDGKTACGDVRPLVPPTNRQV